MNAEFEVAKAAQATLELYLNLAADEVESFMEGEEPGPMGLTPDHIKAMPEYKQARARFDQARANLGAFNVKFLKQFKKELAAERKLRYSTPK